MGSSRVIPDTEAQATDKHSMHLIEYLVAFLITLGVLVTVHELGHYWIARWSGVRVLRFAVGFGRPLWKRVDARGVEWVIAMIPLGGYVRMLDERDSEFAESAAPGDISFGQLHPAWRIAVSLGGPFANFLLAVVAFWVIAIAGSTTYMPILGTVPIESPLARAGGMAGLEVVTVDGDPTSSWQQVSMALATRLGDTGEILLGLRRPGAESVDEIRVEIADWERGVDAPDLLGSLGIVPNIPAVIGQIEPGSAAERAGLLPWDQITALDGASVADWSGMQAAISKLQSGDVTVSIQRNGQALVVLARPELRVTETGERRVLGISPPINEIQYGVFAAVPVAVSKMADTVGDTLALLKKMIFGQVSMANLSGPLTIAQVAGDSARVGWHYFVGILALLSVSLGVLNLLPIPILDGGHVVYATVEWLTGKPVSERIQIVGFQFGMFLVGGLMALALFNDFARIFGG